jgi:addiction module HigA family antidote
MGRMFNPPHPGETIREDVLPALGLSVTEAAEQLGVSRVSFSRVINGKAAISPIMARRLEAWLNGPEHGPSAESWLRGQLAYDLWQAEQAPMPRVQAVSNLGRSGDALSATLCASSPARSQSSKLGRRKAR